MSPSLAIASRNLLRSPKRSLPLIALIGAAFMTVTLIRAGYADMFENVKRANYAANGHLSFSPAAGTELTYGSYRNFAEWADSTGRFARIAAVMDIDGLAGTEERSAPVSGYAVEGEFADWETPDGAVKAELGKALAESLGLTVGDEFSAFLGDAGFTLELARIVETEATVRDRFFIRLPIEAFFARGLVRRVDRALAWTVAGERDRLGLIREAQVRPGLAACDWRAYELGNTEINSIIRVYEDNFVVVLVVVGLVILLALANVMILARWERGAELGAMLSLGTPPSRIALILVLESLCLALAACAAGTVLSLAVCFAVNLAGGVTFPPPPTAVSPIRLTLSYEPRAFALAAGLSLACATAAGLAASAGLKRTALIELLFERN